MNLKRFSKTTGSLILAAAMTFMPAVSTIPLIIAPGCDNVSKKEDLEKRLTEFDIVTAHFGPSDKVYYAARDPPSDPAIHTIYELSLNEPTASKKSRKELIDLFELEGKKFLPGIPGGIGMYSTEHGIAVISSILPPEYREMQKENPSKSLLYIFKPDGSLVSSKKTEDRISDVAGFIYGDEKGFYDPFSCGGGKYRFIPLDGSNPVEKEGKIPGLEEHQSNLNTIVNFLKRDQQDFKKVYSARSTKSGIEALYSKNKSEGLYYLIISKEKLSKEK